MVTVGGWWSDDEAGDSNGLSSGWPETTEGMVRGGVVVVDNGQVLTGFVITDLRGVGRRGPYLVDIEFLLF